MTDLVNQVEDGVEDITPFLNEHFDVNGPEGVSAKDIIIVEIEDVEKKISDDETG